MFFSSFSSSFFVIFIDPFVVVQHLNQNLIFCVLNALHQSNLKWFGVVETGLG